MPAVTVPDLLVLPRIPRPDRGRDAARPVVSVTSAPHGLEGEGFPVRRAFAGVDLAALDPFVHMDQMGEVEYAPGEPKGTPWHPHRGFETVTYMIDGTFQHQDSTGGGGLITNGATQWMTAGAGILHIEKPPEELIASGGLFHGIQLWVNLPAAQKWVPPRYQDIGAQRVTLLASADGASLVRVIAGDVAGHSGPGVTHTAMAMVHATRDRRVRSSSCPGRPDSTPWSTSSPGPARWGRAARRSGWAAGRARERRLRHPRRRRAPGEPRPGPRRADPRRAAHPRAGGRLRTVRHEPARRAGPGLRGLPGRASWAASPPTTSATEPAHSTRPIPCGDQHPLAGPHAAVVGVRACTRWRSRTRTWSRRRRSRRAELTLDPELQRVGQSDRQRRTRRHPSGPSCTPVTST